jgi:hypothetical protein
MDFPTTMKPPNSVAKNDNKGLEVNTGAKVEEEADYEYIYNDECIMVCLIFNSLLIFKDGAQAFISKGLNPKL